MRRSLIGSVRLIGVTIVLALVSVVPILVTASAAHPTLECGTTINQDTTLKNNMGEGSAGHCTTYGIIIGANNITLNCRNHAIVGSNQPGSVGIYLSGVTGVKIENCNPIFFDFGIYVLSSSNNVLKQNGPSQVNVGFRILNSSHDKFESNTVYYTPIGFRVNVSTSNTFTGNNVSGGSQGFYVQDSSGNKFSGNTVDNTKQDGFYVLPTATGNTFTSNHANAEGSYGYYDLSSGSGTLGTANTYTTDGCYSNGIAGSNPSGLCTPQS